MCTVIWLIFMHVIIAKSKLKIGLTFLELIKIFKSKIDKINL